jgi:hypothetical protein
MEYKLNDFEDLEFIELSKNYFEFYQEEKKKREININFYKNSNKKYNVENYLPEDDEVSLNNLKFYSNELKSEPQGNFLFIIIFFFYYII